MVDRKIGLVIANSYKEPIKLNYAERDAIEIKKSLEYKPNYEFEFEEPLINRNHSEVFEEIERILSNADQSDTILIYFSGHGQLDDKGNLCLKFNETKPKLLYSTSLPFEYIDRCIKKSPSERVIMILDCCFSGAAGEKGEEIEKRIEENLEAASGSGKIILTSSAKYQTSKEDTKLKHGVFTNYLLEGLKSEKVADEHGHITIDGLYNYAYEKTNQRNPDQTPLKKGTFKGELIIGKNPKRILDIQYSNKLDKLIEMRSLGLQRDLYYEAVNILDKEKDNLLLTPIETKIKHFLEDLLEDKIDIHEYIKTVEKIKNPLKNVDNKEEIDGIKNFKAIDKWKKIFNKNLKRIPLKSLIFVVLVVVVILFLILLIPPKEPTGTITGSVRIK
jgi:hypothetical protein